MSPRGSHRASRSIVLDDAVDGLSLALAVALVAVIAGHRSVSLRLGLAVPFVLFVPGWAVVTNSVTLKRRGPLTLSVLLSLALLAVVATVPLWLHYWRPLGSCEVEGVSSGAVIIVGFLRRGLTPGQVAESRLTVGRLTPHLRYTDVFLICGIALWVIGIIRSMHGRTLGQFGLLPDLSPFYFVGLGVVVASFVVALNIRRLSRLRMSLHVLALVLMLFGTAPLLYAAPRYAWQYKLIGVVEYIQTHGRVNPHIDIYQNWPGFFAAIAWFDRLGGLQRPDLLAKWAQPGVELLACLMLSFAFRALALSDRERWLALGLYLGSAWVAQDYLSPQALGAVLSAGTLGIALHWFVRSEPGPTRTPRFFRSVAYRLDWLREPPRKLTNDGGTTVAGMRTSDGGSALIAGLALVLVFAALVGVHELTPYAVLIQLGLLALLRWFRPIWLYVLLLAIALAYLAPRFPYVNSHFGVFASIGNFFGNAKPPSVALASPELGLQLSYDASLVLSLGMWLLGGIGALRRWRAREPIGVLAALAAAPILVLAAESYGGEAILRVFLYSVPWTACLAVAALRPLRVATAVWERCALQATAMLTAFALFLPAFFGQDELNVLPSGQVTAVIAFYRNARPGEIFTVSDNFPASATADYPLFYNTPLFGPGAPLRNGHIQPTSGPEITKAIERANPSSRPSYVMLTGTMITYAKAYGFPTLFDIRSLRRALSRAPGWIVVSNKSGVWIVELP